MPERVFWQEYHAEFVNDVGGVFEAVREVAVEDYELPFPPADEAVGYAIVVDFARIEDHTAIVVLDPDGRLVVFDRVNQTTWRRPIEDRAAGRSVRAGETRRRCDTG